MLQIIGKIMKCPKCGHEQNENIAECMKCGVIFTKYIPREEKQKSLENDDQNTSDAAIDLQAEKTAKATSRSVFKTSLLIVIAFLSLILIANISLSLLKNALFGEHELEQFGLTYKQYLRKTKKGRIKLPESSENIDIFSFHIRDYWCNAVQAEVKEGVPDLRAIVSDYNLYNVTHPIIVENVSVPMETLSIVIGAYDTPEPSWLAINDPMIGFDINVLKYGRGGSYGRGIWAFYCEHTHTLRVFSWSMQHLFIGPFEGE